MDLGIPTARLIGSRFAHAAERGPSPSRGGGPSSSFRGELESVLEHQKPDHGAEPGSQRGVGGASGYPPFPTTPGPQARLQTRVRAAGGYAERLPKESYAGEILPVADRGGQAVKSRIEHPAITGERAYTGPKSSTFGASNGHAQDSNPGAAPGWAPSLPGAPPHRETASRQYGLIAHHSHEGLRAGPDLAAAATSAERANIENLSPSLSLGRAGQTDSSQLAQRAGVSVNGGVSIPGEPIEGNARAFPLVDAQQATAGAISAQVHGHSSPFEHAAATEPDSPTAIYPAGESESAVGTTHASGVDPGVGFSDRVAGAHSAQTPVDCETSVAGIGESRVSPGQGQSTPDGEPSSLGTPKEGAAPAAETPRRSGQAGTFVGKTLSIDVSGHDLPPSRLSLAGAQSAAEESAPSSFSSLVAAGPAQPTSEAADSSGLAIVIERPHSQERKSRPATSAGDVTTLSLRAFHAGVRETTNATGTEVDEAGRPVISPQQETDTVFGSSHSNSDGTRVSTETPWDTQIVLPVPSGHRAIPRDGAFRGEPLPTHGAVTASRGMTSAESTQPSGRVQALSVKVGLSDSAQIQLRFLENGGALRIAFSSRDGSVIEGISENLTELISQLQSLGMQPTSTTRVELPPSHSERWTETYQESSADRDHGRDRQEQPQSGDPDHPQSRRPMASFATLFQMEDSTNANSRSFNS